MREMMSGKRISETNGIVPVTETELGAVSRLWRRRINAFYVCSCQIQCRLPPALPCRLCEPVRVERGIAVHFLDVDDHILGGTNTGGPGEVGNVNSSDLPIIIKVVLNRIIAESRQYDDGLAYEQTRLFIEVKPLRRVAFWETDNEVSIAVANFFDAAQHHSRILLLQVQRLVEVGATFHASQR